MSCKTSNTTSLRRHAEAFHKNSWEEFKNEAEKTTPKITKYSLKPKNRDKYKINSKKRKELNQKLVRMIAQDMFPLSMVKYKGFSEYSKALDPNYVLPSCATLRNKLIPDLDTKVMNEVQMDLDEAKHVSLTTDCWSAPTMDSYCAYTIHYLKHGKLTSKVLECSKFDKRHFSENLQKDLERVIADYKLDGKLISVTADNAYNIQKAIRDLKCTCNVVGVGCLAHGFNLDLKKAIKHCAEVVALEDKIAKTVKFIRKCHSAKKFFEDCQRLTGRKIVKVLLRDVRTRWNSFYSSLERFVELKDALELFFAKECKEHQLSAEEWTLAEQLVKVLRPLYEATMEISGEKFTSISKVIPLVNRLIEIYYDMNYANPSMNEDVSYNAQMVQKVGGGIRFKYKIKKVHEVINDFKQNIGSNLVKRFGDNEQNQTMRMATFLDPRFKQFGFSNPDVVKLASNDSAIEALKVDEEMNPPDSGGTMTENYDFEPSLVSVLWGPLEEKKANQNQFTENHNKKEMIEVEMQKYLAMKAFKSIKTDPLEWWFTDGKRLFPLLSNVATKYLIVPATSVPSERVFSVSGALMNAKRLRLGHLCVNQIVRLHGNL